MAIGLAIATAGVAQEAAPDVDTAANLKLPENPQLFGNALREVVKAMVIVNGEVITQTDIDQRLALMAIANNAPIPANEIERLRQQVLSNLIENSVRHAHGPVHVTVAVAERDAMVEWRVSDDGPGFSPDARANVFEPFRSTAGSSGLGLTLCKAIVEAHGGTLTIDDQVARGASIRFTVRRAS